jgi:hypothetical protein
LGQVEVRDEGREVVGVRTQAVEDEDDRRAWGDDRRVGHEDPVAVQGGLGKDHGVLRGERFFRKLP